MVILKTGIVVFFIALGAFYVHPSNWHPFAPNGFTGMMSGAAIVFFAFIGFDAVSTASEEARNPQRDVPIGILASLAICTVLYVAVSAVLTGMQSYTRYVDDAAAIATAVEVMHKPWVEAVVSAGAVAGMTSVLLVFQLGMPRIFMSMSRDVAAAAGVREDSSQVPHAACHDDPGGRDRGNPGALHRRGLGRGSHQHRDLLRLRAGVRRCAGAAP